MNDELISFSDLRVLQLSVDNIGPFRNGLQTLKFEGSLGLDKQGRARGAAPSNLFMLLAKNGQGKTTLLECIYGLMHLLGSTSPNEMHPAILSPGARIQLDIRVILTIGDRTQTVLLSIWIGDADPVFTWTDSALEDVAQASTWARLGLARHGRSVEIGPGADQLGQMIRRYVIERVGQPPTALRGESSDLPCVLFFPATRAIFAPEEPRSVVRPVDWGYRPALRFERDGPEWGTSVDNLLIWLEWLDDGRLTELLEYLNSHIFAEDDKAVHPPLHEELATMVATSSGTHPLAWLSHGERALLQFYARTLCHMTSNTVVLIDELELHLHTKWMNRLYQAIKQLLRDTPSLAVFFTTHDRELMQVFDHSTVEPNLIKGGFLIEEGLN